MTELADAIQKLAWSGTTDPTKAKVLSVNKEDNTVEVYIEEGEAIIPDAMLLCMIDNPDEKFVVYPKVSTEEEESYVTLDFLNDDLRTAIVTKVHNVDEILMRGDSFGGLVKVEALVERMNAIENKLNALLEKWNLFCLAYAPGATPPTLSDSTVAEIDLTTVEPLQNEKIKHG